jgi:hypothetical protein
MHILSYNYGKNKIFILMSKSSNMNYKYSRTSNGIRIRCPNTVCRLEDRKHPAEKPAIEFVNNTFNPSGRYERGWFLDLDSKLNEVNDTLKMLIVAVTRGSNYDLSRRGSDFNAAAN